MRLTIQRLWALYDDAREDLEKVAEHGSEQKQEAAERRVRQLRDRLVVNYSPLVKYAAGRVSARMTGAVDREDLNSWGVLGLLDAVKTFDPDKGAKFETYAISKIRWAILDEMRRLDPLPRRVRQRVREAQRVRDDLEQELHRAPTEREVAGEMGVSVREHQEFMGRYQRAQTWSLEASAEAAGELGRGLHQILADHMTEGPEDAAEAREMRVRLVEAIRDLGERERVVTTFYFYEGLTLREIGKALDLTEGRISQILRQALNKLRGALTDDPATG